MPMKSFQQFTEETKSPAYEKGFRHGETGYGFQKPDAGRKGSPEYKEYSRGYDDGVDVGLTPEHLREDGEGGGVPVNNAGGGNIAGIGIGPKGEPGVNLRKKKKPLGEEFLTVDLLRTLGRASMATEGAEEFIAKRLKALKEKGETDTQEYRYLTLQLEATKAEIESAAKAVHDNWVQVQKDAGHEEHKSPDGKEDYMVDYEDLTEPAKELDRGAVLATIDALGLDEEHDTFAGARVFEVDMDRVMNSRFGKNRYHRYSKYVGNDEAGESIRQHGRSGKGDIILKDSATAVMTYLRRRAAK